MVKDALHQQRAAAPPRPRKKDPPFLTMLFLGLVGTIPLTYYYWQYREAQMKQKKQAILERLQARAAQAKS